MKEDNLAFMRRLCECVRFWEKVLGPKATAGDGASALAMSVCMLLDGRTNDTFEVIDRKKRKKVWQYVNHDRFHAMLEDTPPYVIPPNGDE